MDFIYQVSTAINMAAAPGLQNTWTKSSNTVQGAIGLGDTYIGFQTHELGKLKFGEMYMPVQNLDGPAESLRGAARQLHRDHG